MLSNTCKTAIKAVIYLASRPGSEENSGVREIAKHIGTSEHIINSIKGPNGGFYITDKQRGQPIMAIVDTIDGKDLFKKCGLGLSECSSERPCPIHDDYRKGKDIIEKLFRTRTIDELCGPVESGLAYLIG